MFLGESIMNNSAKLNVGVKFILAVVLCLPFEACPAVVCKKYVFVCACDDAYVTPTAVMIRSLMETNLYPKAVVILLCGVKFENRQRLEAMADDVTAICGINLCDEIWKTMLSFDEQPIDLMESVKGVGEGRLDGVSFINSQSGTNSYKSMINLRFFLPEIFASRLLPEELWGIDCFLWLDSDLIVRKNLSWLWGIAVMHSYQRMFGADLNYDPSDLNCRGNCLRPIELPCVVDGVLRISGGVVLWRIKPIIEDCRVIHKNVFANTISRMGHPFRFDREVYTFVDGDCVCDEKYSFSTEEHVFTVYSQETLRRLNPGALFCVLPFSCNMAKVECLPLFDGKADFIAIFHWDSMIKPWKSRSLSSKIYGMSGKSIGLWRRQVMAWRDIARRLRFTSDVDVGRGEVIFMLKAKVGAQKGTAGGLESAKGRRRRAK
jgi:hypothetical protein